MNKKGENLIGKIFGKLKVIERDLSNKSNFSVWVCKCECGNIKNIRGTDLRRGHTKSCGCITNVHKNKSTENGKTKRLYRIWVNMKKRCYNEKNKDYKYYGLKGINVCNIWLNSFDAFYEWSHNNDYDDSLTIDRIDSNGNYEPDNCRWTTMITQSDNKTSTPKYFLQGNYYTLRELSILYNVKHTLINNRIQHGWSLEEAIELIKREHKTNSTGLTYKAIRIFDNYEETFTNQKKFAEKYNISYVGLNNCIRGKSKTCGGWKVIII